MVPVYGGYGSILLLDNLKEISISKQKVICGKSDATVLLNALWKTKSIQTISGLDFSKICNKDLSEEEFEKIIHLLQGSNITYLRPRYYNDGYWYISDRAVYKHEGWHIINSEKYFFSGTVVGGNLDSHTEPSFPFIIGGNMEIDLKEEYLSIRW